MRAAANELTDHWVNILRAPVGTHSDHPVLTGRFENIVDIYRQIPSGRLVILGGAGAGKTTALIRLALGLLADYSQGDRVPVVLNIASWSPEEHTLQEWLMSQLQADFPSLARPIQRDGPSAAKALVSADRILPILDGFDELSTTRHAPVLEQLSRFPDTPLVVGSRRAEYAVAVTDADVLTAAAVVQLCALTLDDLSDYLPRSVGGKRTGVWDETLKRMRLDPDAPGVAALLEVLSTPLMVFLGSGEH